MPEVVILCEVCGDDIVDGNENECDICNEGPLCDKCYDDHECEIEDEEIQ